MESCTIIVTEANALTRPIHDRMPVILAPSDYATWLNPAIQAPERLLPLLKPYETEAMRVYAISTRVNSPQHDDPAVLEGI